MKECEEINEDLLFIKNMQKQIKKDIKNHKVYKNKNYSDQKPIHIVFTIK